MDYETIYQKMMLEKYYTSKELIYDKKAGIELPAYQYLSFVDFKSKKILAGYEGGQAFDLLSFNDAPLHFSMASELINCVSLYLNSIIDDFNKNNSPLSFRQGDELTLSRIYSEIEGSLNIESVPTTRKAVDDLAKGKRDPKTLNEQIIKNMILGIEFVHQSPEFNEANLHALYSILSEGCLDNEDKLLEGNLYRHDGVTVGGYAGCPSAKIKPCMDSLFAFVNKNLKNADLAIYLPHIAHYYIAYIHPYFDYNGRTARMVSYWISLLLSKGVVPPVASEAINQTKNHYYDALSETRDSKNDLTYFFLYVFDISTKYFLTYRNIEEIIQSKTNEGIDLSSNEIVYLKKILISNKGRFSYVDFARWSGIEFTKQGALKVLNAFEAKGLLLSSTSSSGKKLFEVNQDIIKYSI